MLIFCFVFEYNSPFLCHLQILIADHVLITHGNLYTSENVATASNKVL